MSTAKVAPTQVVQGQVVQGQIVQAQVVAVGGATVAPVPAQMDRGARGIEHLAALPNLMVKQTRRGCVQECMGCEAKNEFRISTMDNPRENLMYSLEDSSCLCRQCCRSQRAMKQTIWMGQDSSGGDATKVLSAEKGWSAMLGNCNCCCNPYLNFFDAQNAPLGKVTVPFFCFVPKYMVFDEHGTLEYNIHQPTCCCGVCINCCAEGPQNCCACRIPYFIYEGSSKDHSAGQEVGKVVKVWSGLGTELFTDADTFTVEFPANASAAARARVVGFSFLLNILEYEGGQKK